MPPSGRCSTTSRWPPSRRSPTRAEGVALRLTVERALARLSTVQRTTLRMAYGEGKSYREIAEETGVPTGTVKSRGRAALDQLAVVLA